MLFLYVNEMHIFLRKWQHRKAVGQTLLSPPSCSDRECNPSLLSILQQITAPTLAPLVIENQTSVVITDTEEPVLTSPYLQWWDAQSIVGLALFVLCILYSR